MLSAYLQDGVFPVNACSKPKFTNVQGYVGTKKFKVQNFIDLVCYIVILAPVGYGYSQRRTEKC